MRWTLTVTAAIAVVAAHAAAARPAGVSSCWLLTGKQAASVGVTSSCKLRSLNGPGFTVSNGTWGKPLPGSAALTVGVNTYARASGPAWQVAMQTLPKLPGRAKKVSGIGSVAYESGGTGSTLSSIHFVVGKHIVSMSWYAKKPPSSLKTFNALAQSIAAKL